jgi:hypothetical protein
MIKFKNIKVVIGLGTNKAHESLEKMLGWQDMCESPPTTLLEYYSRERL